MNTDRAATPLSSVRTGSGDFLLFLGAQAPSRIANRNYPHARLPEPSKAVAVLCFLTVFNKTKILRGTYGDARVQFRTAPCTMAKARGDKSLGKQKV